ncbi:MAG: hypothetical protein A2042_01495 [Candidatus Schekmanbacteria bacterium GWA2_38_11]|uniref:Uncharacterized protein n=1 Tax=Candidatus Schekmanbacteria bacterium GWA2_38_11 TaxID=1817876 RepID=A0A1F7RJ63_9BACT|nr:MAG: hypothetical protein A2042_01495 [Candidatus Schekmanbacteria bacterium GWA2_38_11]
MKYLPEKVWIPYVLTVKIKKYGKSLLDFDILKTLPKEVKIARTHLFSFYEQYNNILKLNFNSPWSCHGVSFVPSFPRKWESRKRTKALDSCLRRNDRLVLFSNF